MPRTASERRTAILQQTLESKDKNTHQTQLEHYKKNKQQQYISEKSTNKTARLIYVGLRTMLGLRVPLLHHAGVSNELCSVPAGDHDETEKVNM